MGTLSRDSIPCNALGFALSFPQVMEQSRSDAGNRKVPLLGYGNRSTYTRGFRSIFPCPVSAERITEETDGKESGNGNEKGKAQLPCLRSCADGMGDCLLLLRKCDPFGGNGADSHPGKKRIWRTDL